MLTAATVTPLAGAPAIFKVQSWFAGFPFVFGVTSDDPAPDGFVVDQVSVPVGTISTHASLSVPRGHPSIIITSH
ncbi:hypothetical protein [Sphingobium sp.]|uniref:hypothetical protein n=1 Tax=Sphingobium sp. TaxID=1912891 RepID=UPI002CBB508C|nr:hypothetical protein [Sphingobium sp.]HUD92336.1 hypothetical protein [Sphingobium sp.]